MSERAEQEIEERVVPARCEPQAGGVAMADQLCKPGVVQMAAQIAGSDVAMPENGREDRGGNRQQKQLVLSYEHEGLREDGCGRLRLRKAFHDFVFSRVGPVCVVVLRQEGRLGGCERLHCIAANISRDELPAAGQHAGLGESRCGVIYEFRGNVNSARLNGAPKTSKATVAATAESKTPA